MFPPPIYRVVPRPHCGCYLVSNESPGLVPGTLEISGFLIRPQALSYMVWTGPEQAVWHRAWCCHLDKSLMDVMAPGTHSGAQSKDRGHDREMT